MSRDSLLKAFHRLYWPIIIIITLFISYIYISGFHWEASRAGFSQLIDGTAYKPYVYRVLVPFMIKMAAAILPLPTQLYGSVFMCFFLFGFVICIRSFSALYWKNKTINNFVSIIAIIMLIPFMLTIRHVYDFSTLFLFSFALLLMAQKKWMYFFIVYTLACLNKETTILLSFVFMYYFRGNLKTPLFWKLAGLQVAIYTCIRLLIMWRFNGNPGVVMENHLYEHLSFLQSFPVLISGYLIYLIVMITAIKKDWKKKPVFLREALVILAPLMFILYLLGGGPFEIRVFYELYPLLILLAAPTFGYIFRLDFFAEQLEYSANLQPLSAQITDIQEQPIQG